MSKSIGVSQSNNYFTHFMFFCMFYVFFAVPYQFAGKEYFAKLNQQSGAGSVFFGPLEPEPLEKNTRSRSHLGIKLGAGATINQPLPSPGLKNALFFLGWKKSRFAQQKKGKKDYTAIFTFNHEQRYFYQSIWNSNLNH